jgi:hypothetical protein
LTNRSTKPYPWPPKQAQPDVSKPGRSTFAMDYADEQHSGVAEETPPKIKAEENPWYLLATLYGVPEQSDRELREKNRIAWNRYFAANFNEATRARLVEEKRHPQNELNPFQRHELEEIKEAYLILLSHEI